MGNAQNKELPELVVPTEKKKVKRPGPVDGGPPITPAKAQGPPPPEGTVNLNVTLLGAKEVVYDLENEKLCCTYTWRDQEYSATETTRARATAIWESSQVLNFKVRGDSVVVVFFQIYGRSMSGPSLL
eukprot:GHVU01148915.1.p1 GENE.GHVU01148915.1~~GHVU01148915.1.p1  ORF type:complete len:128 (+),score=16.38 GHVU01148915.1:303-686(+)